MVGLHTQQETHACSGSPWAYLPSPMATQSRSSSHVRSQSSPSQTSICDHRNSSSPIGQGHAPNSLLGRQYASKPDPFALPGHQQAAQASRCLLLHSK